MGTSNPISNEVNFKINDVMQSYQVDSQQNKKRDPMNSGINPITSTVDHFKPIASETPQATQVKNFVPPTTQKVYGSFLDSSKIDQMINMLKQQK